MHTLSFLQILILHENFRRGDEANRTKGKRVVLGEVSLTPSPLVADVYDARRDNPAVLVTSPGSPDLHGQRVGHGRHGQSLGKSSANVGGKMQVKLWFDAGALQLQVTIVCAAGLVPRGNGEPRNPYAKMILLPDKR